MNKDEITKNINESLIGQEFFLNSIEPNAYISYNREYYEDMNNTRVTFDHNITYSYLSNNIIISNLEKINDSKIIMEIKFSQDKKDLVSKMIQSLNLTPMRNSKYVNALARFGLITYI
jgi:hypothetical protein